MLSRFVQYNQTSLERTYKHELLTEHDLGVTIDLINPDTYKDQMSKCICKVFVARWRTFQCQKSTGYNKTFDWAHEEFSVK